MRILVIGGMHGNEPLGTNVVKHLLNKPVRGVTALIANEMAYKAHSRFVEQDMNRSFPGTKNSHAYEHRRPYELLKIARKYDVVLDFHNTHCPNNDCGFVGEKASQSMFGVAEFFGLKHIVVADYDCINKYAPNCISVEISLSSPLNSAEIWCNLIQRLAKTETLPSGKNLKRYKFVYRMTLDDQERYDLDKKHLKAFEKMDVALANKLDVGSPAYPIFINDAYTPYNFGGILQNY